MDIHFKMLDPNCNALWAQMTRLLGREPTQDDLFASLAVPKDVFLGTPPPTGTLTITASNDEDPFQRLARLIRWPAQRLAEQVRSQS